MALSVFGTPITKVTLSKREEYMGRSDLSLREIATATFEMKNDGRDARAREFVEERRLKYGFDAALCLIYNATGDTIRLITYCDGGDCIAPSPYPMLIMNGQWGAYLKRGPGSVVYSVKNEQGYEYQVVFSYWALDPGRCYTEIRQRDYYKPKDPWANYATPLNTNLSYIYQTREYGLASFASIGGTTRSAVFEGIITLDGAWSRYDESQYYQPPPRDLGYQDNYSRPRALMVEGAEADNASAENQEPDPADTSMEK